VSACFNDVYNCLVLVADVTRQMPEHFLPVWDPTAIETERDTVVSRR